MEQILSAIVQKLGLPESTVRSSAAALLGFLHSKVKGTEYEQFIDAIPGARQLAEEAPKSSGSGGGLLSSLLGGEAADMASVMSKLQAAGLPADKILPFAKTFLDQVRQQVGPEEVDKVLAKFPMLQKMLG